MSHNTSHDAHAIRELRRAAGLNQQLFATKLGISMRSLNSYERGQRGDPATRLAFLREAHRQGFPEPMTAAIRKEFYTCMNTSDTELRMLLCDGSLKQHEAA